MANQMFFIVRLGQRREKRDTVKGVQLREIVEVSLIVVILIYLFSSQKHMCLALPV